MAQQTFSFDGFVAEFGCSKTATGGYCARLIMDELSAKPDDTAAKCGYFTSCCFGEMHRCVRVCLLCLLSWSLACWLEG